MHLEMVPSVTYQKIEGFGGAVTDAAAINWKSLEPSLQYYIIKYVCNVVILGIFNLRDKLI